MDPNLRNLKGLQNRISELQATLLKRFNNLVDLAAVRNPDRSATAVAQYQIQAETAGLIRAAEDVQTLIRQLQEMWLFGQLNTLGDSQLQRETDENAKQVAELLKQLTESQGGLNGAANGDVKEGTTKEGL